MKKIAQNDPGKSNGTRNNGVDDDPKCRVHGFRGECFRVEEGIATNIVVGAVASS